MFLSNSQENKLSKYIGISICVWFAATQVYNINAYIFNKYVDRYMTSTDLIDNNPIIIKYHEGVKNVSYNNYKKTNNLLYNKKNINSIIKYGNISENCKTIIPFTNYNN